MGFLDAIGTVLGGWSDVNQIDKEGFDFREKRAQDEFLRQRQREAARQADEERNLKMAEDVLSGAGEGETPDITPFLQATSPEQRNLMTLLTKGRAKERKSALEEQKTYRDMLRQQMTGTQREREIGLRGDEAEELARIRAELEAGRKLSPRDQAMLGSAEKRTDIMAAARRQGVGGPTGGRPQLRQVQDERGNTVYRWLSPGEEARAPATAVERQATGMAQTVRDNVRKMEKLAGEVTSGPILGRISKAYQSQYPSGQEADFDFLGNAVIDTVYVKSGKQINETEMGILKSMIPDRGRGDLPGQVARFKTYADSLLRKYGAPEGGGQSGDGGGEPPRITSVQDYAALPSGTVYIDPTGKRRRKP